MFDVGWPLVLALDCSNFDLSNSGYIIFAIAKDPGADITEAIVCFKLVFHTDI